MARSRLVLRVAARLCGVVLIGASLMLLTGLTQDAGRWKRNQRFKAQRSELVVGQLLVVDKEGRPRILLEVDDDGPSMSLHDAIGQGRIKMSVSESRSYVALYDSMLLPRLSLEVDMADVPTIATFDERGQSRSVLRLDSAGNPSLAFFDGMGLDRAAMGLFGASSEAQVFMKSSSGTPVLRLPR
ncbi:MAG: hypothetical protein RL885_26250 [Planctomycetota bacterium]